MANRQAFSPDSAPSNSQNHKSVSSKATILGAATIAIVLVFVAGWLCFCFRTKLCAGFRTYRKRKGKLEAQKLHLRRFHLEEVQKATNNFSQDCLVGSGAFGNVYRGTLGDDGLILAIKKPHSESYTSTEDFRNEVRLLSTVKHNNLVGLVGFCEETGQKAVKILVYEYVTNGSLLDYIMGRTEIFLTWDQRVKISIGAAKGIAHLHEGINPSIIHRDIKPSNILIGENFEAKVSDFGLVRSGPVGDKSHVSSLIKGTPGYLDPAYCASFHLTPFTDVYSFGVILLQLLAARPAVESGRSSTISHIIDWARPSIERGRIDEILDANLLLEGSRNMEMMLKMGQLALRCVVKIPKERPKMTQVCQELEAAFNFVNNTILPKPPLATVGSQRSSIGKSNRTTSHTSRLSAMDDEYSQSIVSVDGIGLQKFRVDIENLSFQSASLRCLETSLSMDDDFIPQ